MRPMTSNLSWKHRLSVMIFSAALSASCRKNFTVNRRLWSFFDFKIPPSENPHNGVKTWDVTIDHSRNLWFRVYAPATSTCNSSTATNMPFIIYIHGGGFALFTADSIACELGCKRLVRELGVILISVSYRLAPEHKFPCQYEDCFDAIKFIDANWDCLPIPAACNADPNKCFLLGDSAGGNLIHHAAVKASKYYEFKKLNIKGLISVQPFFGGEERTESEIRLAVAPVLDVKKADWFWKAFLPDGSNRDHPAANVFGPNSIDITEVKFPPTLLFIGGCDPLQDWQRRYCQGMKKYGKEVHLIEYPNAIHGFWGSPDLPEYASFINEAKEFIFMKKKRNNQWSLRNERNCSVSH